MNSYDDIMMIVETDTLADGYSFRIDSLIFFLIMRYPAITNAMPMRKTVLFFFIMP
jgi:hypothetical protein